MDAVDIRTVSSTEDLYVAWQVVEPINQTWRMILRRCEDEKSADYPRYGGRGIKLCAAWHDFRVFLEDILTEIGPRPSETYESGWPKFSLDRTDNEGHYEPGNVRWATAFEQSANRRNVRCHEILPGTRFGRLVVLRETTVAQGKPLRSGTPRKQRAAEVRCDCGSTRVVTLTNLLKKQTLDQLARPCKCRKVA